MNLTERKKKILRAVVDRYVETAEPVGSKGIATELNVSSATVRNEMADLENMGLLEQPHTSAGRVPTSLGYRIYVNELMEQQRLSLEDTELINKALRSRVQQLDKIISEAGRVTSLLTNYPAYALAVSTRSVTITRFDLIHVDKHTFVIVAILSNDTVKNKLVHLHFEVEADMLSKLSATFNARFTGLPDEEITPVLIQSTERAVGDTTGLVSIIAGFAIEILMDTKSRETFLTGTSHLLELPEFQDIGKAKKVLKYLSNLMAFDGYADANTGRITTARYLERGVNLMKYAFGDTDSFNILPGKRLYKFDTLEIIQPSDESFMNVSVDSYLEGDEGNILNVNLRFKKTDGGWRLDGPTY